MDLMTHPRNETEEKILIVDDDPDTCKLLQLLFQRQGYHALTATSGGQAIQQVEIESPDLVVLDVLMPEMDGWETFRRVRQISDSPVLFLTALASGECAAQALQMGADDYLRKPYSNVELLARAETALTRAKNSANGSKNGWDRPPAAGERTIVAVIPAYNEERFIGSVVLKVLKQVNTVIVVDDGSSDATGQVARDAGAIVFSHSFNQGKGVALNTAFCRVRDYHPDAVVILDGDGQHLPDELDMVVAPILNDQADIVVGSRYIQNNSHVPRHRIWGHRAFNLITRFSSGIRTSDSQSGYRAFSPKAVEAIAFHSEGFSVESEIPFIAKEHDLRLLEVPVTIRYEDPPKRSVIAHGLIVLGGILRLVGQYRPLFFFGLPGAAFLLTGLGWGLWVMERFIQTRQLATGHAFIFVLLFLTGQAMLSTGIILHSVRGLLHDMLLGRVKHNRG